MLLPKSGPPVLQSLNHGFLHYPDYLHRLNFFKGLLKGKKTNPPLKS